MSECWLEVRQVPFTFASPHHQPLLPPANRAVTLFSTRSKGINTLTPRTLSHRNRATDDSSSALQPPSTCQRSLTRMRGAEIRSCWQRSPKSLGRPWLRASQLRKGQKIKRQPERRWGRGRNRWRRWEEGFLFHLVLQLPSPTSSNWQDKCTCHGGLSQRLLVQKLALGAKTKSQLLFWTITSELNWLFLFIYLFLLNVKQFDKI